jgi:hypothetical protein
MKVNDMILAHPKTDDPYRRYAELLLAQHRLLCRNVSTDDLDAIEDEMTRLWDVLDNAQSQSLSGLSSDLNGLRRGGKLAPKARSRQEVSALDLQRLHDAREGGDWHFALHQLRLCAARLTPFELAFWRATAWQALGLLEIAGLFSQFAARLEPSNARLAVLPLPIESQPDTASHARSIN